MSGRYNCISADGHIDLNPDVWRDRVQAKFGERAPKRVKMPNGSDAVVIDGGKPNTIGITRSVRVAHADLAKQVPTFETCAGTGTPEQRLAEQDQDGEGATQAEAQGRRGEHRRSAARPARLHPHRQGLRHAARRAQVRPREGQQDPLAVPDLTEQDDRRALRAPAA